MSNNIKKYFRIPGLLIFIFILQIRAEQININRVEMMPNLPQPYVMRDWKKVALDYDNLVFDLERNGDYLPLIWINNNTSNYPEHSSFGLHTVVGTPYPSNAEAINVLPAVIGASLIGIDKRNQDNYNWVLGCEEWFNRRPEENVYLNNPVTQSGDDWWYHTMPNIFFYQLYNLYPETGDFSQQLISVADQWLKAVQTMGGAAAPWSKAFMDYRGWYLSTMQPYNQGISEPEAAGAIAWILYNAYIETGRIQYRWGAEWAMEFLNDYSDNAAYELQLPYGVYTAARMNAELGTQYNVEKMLNWCFDPDGNVRSWGVTLGNWGGYDCDGLVGEALNTGYAFAMNGFEMAGALLPMLRYDDRFARALGKWALNMANASRLFYSEFLPAENQDGEAWSTVYDPESCIAHESIREFALGSGISPFATGDAILGGWGATNFALYGSSHVGILGAIIDTTEISGILKLDLRKTDYFQESAYPTYLFYNPYNENKIIHFDVGQELVDIYDAVTNTIIDENVIGVIQLSLDADNALMPVLIPANAELSYDEDKYLADGIVVDYFTNQIVSNYRPRIKSLAINSTGSDMQIFCTAEDKDGDLLSYLWFAGNDTLDETSSVLNWTMSNNDSIYTLICKVSDGVTPGVKDSILINAYSLNNTPEILKISAFPSIISINDTSTVVCQTFDEDTDKLSYLWTFDQGYIIGTDSTIFWVAPDSAGIYRIRCKVSDPYGAYDVDSVSIIVRDSSFSRIEETIAWYNFDGNANDNSGLNNHGIVHNATIANDRFGNINGAYAFNGLTSNIQISNSQSLNFTQAITVSFWMNAAELYTTRESYPISHGNWENRWKVSIIPEKKLRWTIKTEDGIKDLDSQTEILTNMWYHIAVSYDGIMMKIYINGILNSEIEFSGYLLTTNIDLMIGQVLPTQNQYNFNGVLDDIRIYDWALTQEDFQDLNNIVSAVSGNSTSIPKNFELFQNYPNPFNPVTMLKYQLPEDGRVKLTIYDINGRELGNLVNTFQRAGIYSVRWNASQLSSGLYLYILEMKNKHIVRKCIKLK